MDSALVMHRLHFAFTITYHYLFPQLTMGLALLILILKTMALWTRDERYSGSARFWLPSDMNQGSTAARWFRRAWAAGDGLGDSFVAVCLSGLPSNFSYLTFVSPGSSVTKTNSMDLR